VARSRTPVPAAVPPPRLEPRLELAGLLPSGRSLLVGFGLVAAAAASYAIARETPLFAVRTIEVRGAPAATAAEIRRTLRGGLGSSLVSLSGGTVLERVEALPDVVSASYDRDFPHTLRIVVRPELPAVVVRRGADSWLVSRRGRVMRTLPPLTHRGLPRVWLPRIARVRIGEILDDASGGLATRALASIRTSPLARSVRGAVLSPREGLVLTLHSGVRVKLGAPTDVPLKLAVAERIVPVLPIGTTTLDVSVPERPVSDSNPQPAG
jgi:cell division protein FtsQ